MVLPAKCAMVIAWGPEFRFFYNDGYRPMIGHRHPAALGAPPRIVFPEVWPIAGPLLEQARRGESVAVDDLLLPLDRSGYLENAWFTLAYSPIRDESGGVGGARHRHRDDGARGGGAAARHAAGAGAAGVRREDRRGRRRGRRGHLCEEPHRHPFHPVLPQRRGRESRAAGRLCRTVPGQVGAATRGRASACPWCGNWCGSMVAP